MEVGVDLHPGESAELRPVQLNLPAYQAPDADAPGGQVDFRGIAVGEDRECLGDELAGRHAFAGGRGDLHLVGPFQPELRLDGRGLLALLVGSSHRVSSV